MNIKAILTYDGTNYLGFQKTKLGPSIEETLEKALFQILRKKTYLQVASRTDAGVHAKGQVINFFAHQITSLEVLQNSLNAVLPKDIQILSLKKDKAFFHPSLDCKKKTYSYHIFHGKFIRPMIRKTYWHYPYKALDISQMKKASKLLIGIHDFSAFTSKKYDHSICHIENIDIIELSLEELQINITGNRFLYKMIRIIVGTLVNIGRGKISPESVNEILENKKRIHAGLTAPALGLCLEKIEFD